MVSIYNVGDLWYGKNGIDTRKAILKNTTGLTASFLENKLRVKGDITFLQIFINSSPLANEVLLASVMDLSLNELHDANWYWTSGTYGDKASFTRSFINTYLMLDGTPFTATPGWETMTFMNEVKNRDLRLKQTIRLGDYKRISGGVEVPGPPVFSYTFTGYQPIKWALDDMYYDTRDLNINSIALFRLAEVL